MTDLSEREKLVWLGLKRPGGSQRPLAKEVKLLKENVGEWSDYESLVDGDPDLETHQTSLADAGIGEDDAASFTAKIDENFGGWSEYQTFVVDDSESYRGFRNGFSTGRVFAGEQRTAGDEPSAGMRVHDVAGVTYGGQRVPPGTVEIFGNQVHVSKQDAPGGGESSFTYSDMQAGNQTPERYERVYFTATVTNEGGRRGATEPRLRVDGRIVETTGETIEVPPDGSQTVTIAWSFDRLEQVEVAIGDAEPVTVTVFPEDVDVIT